jgi:hypothetical protein
MLTLILAVLATSIQPAGLSSQPTGEPATLRGPAVAAHVDRVTLVSYDFNSRVRRPETSPEHAAVLLMKLGPELQAKVDGVFAHRAEMMDRFVAENLLMLGELDTAHKAGDKLGELALIVGGLRKLNPACLRRGSCGIRSRRRCRGRRRSDVSGGSSASTGRRIVDEGLARFAGGGEERMCGGRSTWASGLSTWGRKSSGRMSGRRRGGTADRGLLPRRISSFPTSSGDHQGFEGRHAAAERGFARA